MRRARILFIRFAGVFLISAVLLSACGPTYPKGKLVESIQKLFKKEVGTDRVTSAMVGRTLYVSFPIENLVTTDLDLPRDVIDKLENAMLSVTRIALSTDENIEFTVLEAKDNAWGVQTTLIRRIEDLKFMYYWKISKQDFDERFILETRRFHPGEKEPAAWRELTLPEFMARWVAFRISFGSRANPFLGILLGAEKVTADYDSKKRVLTLLVEGSETLKPLPASPVSVELLRTSIFEQMNKVETKYLSRLADPKDWAGVLVVKNTKGEVLFQAEREEWKEANKKKQKKIPRAVN